MVKFRDSGEKSGEYPAELGSPCAAQRAMQTPKTHRMTKNSQRESDMIHPSLIAIAAIVVVFGVLNLIEFKRLD